MAVSKEFEAWVLDQLEPFGEVTSRRMFGGAGLYHQGVMFGLVPGSEQTVYLKVSDDTRPEYEALGSRPFQPFDEGPSMSYFEVPAEVLEDPERLADFARRAYEVAVAAKRHRTPRKKKASRRPKAR